MIPHHRLPRPLESPPTNFWSGLARWSRLVVIRRLRHKLALARHDNERLRMENEAYALTIENTQSMLRAQIATWSGMARMIEGGDKKP